jgi:hypothetical protein
MKLPSFYLYKNERVPIINKSIEKGTTQKYLSPPMILVQPRKGEFPGNISGVAPEKFHHKIPMSQSQTSSVNVSEHGSCHF